MTLILTEGGETYAASYGTADMLARGWSTGTIGGSLNIVNPRTGGRCFQGNSVQFWKDLGADAHPTVIVGWGWNRGTNGAGSEVRFLSDARATEHIVIRCDFNGFLYIDRGATNVAVSSTALAPPDAIWRYFEAKVTLSDTVGTVDVYMNGNATPVLSYSGDTKNGGTEVVISSVSIDQSASSALMDDLYIANGAGAAPFNDRLGEIRCYPIFPSGNGNYSQGVGSDGNSTDNYLLVDENPANTTDYSGIATVGNKDSYLFSDVAAAGTVIDLVAAIYAAKSDAGAKSVRLLTRISGTDYTGSDKALATTPSYLSYMERWALSPATGVPWTAAEVNAAEFGWEART